MFEFIRNQARRAQQQRHIKRGAIARKRAIESTPAPVEMVPLTHLLESDSETTSIVNQLSQLPDNPNGMQPDLSAD